MNCLNCGFAYNEDIRIPILLIGCGHSLCKQCAKNLCNSNLITCVECKKESFIQSVDTLPINITLLKITKQKQNQTEAKLCEVHNKVIEGFCEEDNNFLCIDCIFKETHKEHKVSSVIELCKKKRSLLNKICKNALKNEDNLKDLQCKIKTFRENLINTADSMKKEIKKIYTELYDLLHSREIHLYENLK